MREEETGGGREDFNAEKIGERVLVFERKMSYKKRDVTMKEGGIGAGDHDIINVDEEEDRAGEDWRMKREVSALEL